MFESIPFIHNIVNIYNLYYMCFISAWVWGFFSFKPFFFLSLEHHKKPKRNQTKNQTKTNKNKTEQNWTKNTSYRLFNIFLSRVPCPQVSWGQSGQQHSPKEGSRAIHDAKPAPGNGWWGILVLKKGGFTTKGLVLPAAGAEGGLNMRAQGAEAPHCSCILESVSGVSALFAIF